MSEWQAIEAAVRELLGAGIRSASPLAGGSIHDVRRLELEDGRDCVVKVAAAGSAGLLQGEADGLEAIAATGTVRTPAVFGLVRHEAVSVLAMEHLTPGPAAECDWGAFGRRLWNLHAGDVGARYGFAGDNHIGRTPQVNRWCDDWVEFLVTCRLGPQLAMAVDHGRVDPASAASIQSVIDRLDRLVPRRPHPSLLHGDLWSGNALSMEGGEVAVIDPACACGDAWFDIGMMRLFGGFPEACFDAWREGQGDREQSSERIDVAQLYHLLNHVNLFGSGYVGQVRSVVERLA